MASRQTILELGLKIKLIFSHHSSVPFVSEGPVLSGVSEGMGVFETSSNFPDIAEGSLKRKKQPMIVANQMNVAILAQYEILRALAFLSSAYSRHGSNQFPTMAPVMNPPKWPRTSMFLEPSMADKNKEMNKNIMTWHNLSGLWARWL